MFRRKGFTLVELLVVIAIIGILIAHAVAGDSSGAGVGAADELHEQSEADRHSRLHLYHDAHQKSARRLDGLRCEQPALRLGHAGLGLGDADSAVHGAWFRFQKLDRFQIADVRSGERLRANA